MLPTAAAAPLDEPPPKAVKKQAPAEEEPSRSGLRNPPLIRWASKRFVKKQQMRWTEAGAHLLLQVRTQVLNQIWHATLSRWYPVMKAAPDRKAA
jgi:hypothetical protein